ncbi:peptidase inhibitor family I36 protein [Micrococcus sp.]|uniref:peptidase inhibitor family I36 protein n=1 Tax=Micrococcus sp. TaxID=1271 RepID=UPI0026DBA096|nr:peptidase inhibitor family I36 protein [Micrococcus sp.]MDO4239684.1 peptidase inhibitor family I36 protein [Micrococcus sp.]
MSKKLFAGVLVTAALGAGAGSASAALSEVPRGYVGVFKNADYNGLLGYRSGGQDVKNMSAVANDEMSSWTNKTSYAGAWYVDVNGGGNCYTMNSWTDNRYVGSWFNDKASSWRTNGAC